MKKIFFVFPLSIVLLLFNAFQVMAHCPLCTGAVGMAAVTAKYYGMDPSIIGLFVGAFGISTGLWFGRWLQKKTGRTYIPFQFAVMTILSFVLTVVPLRFISTDNIYLPLLWWGEPGSMFNKIYWVDKIIFGSVLGGLLTVIGYGVHHLIKQVHGRVLFPFQGIAITLAFLVIAGVGLYLSLG